MHRYKLFNLISWDSEAVGEYSIQMEVDGRRESKGDDGGVKENDDHLHFIICICIHNSSFLVMLCAPFCMVLNIKFDSVDTYQFNSVMFCCSMKKRAACTHIFI